MLDLWMLALGAGTVLGASLVGRLASPPTPTPAGVMAGAGAVSAPEAPTMVATTQPTPVATDAAAADAGADSGDAVERLCPALDMTPGEHARGLIDWLTGEGIADSPALAAGYIIEHADLIEAYADMCAERRWRPLPWLCFAALVTEATGGKKYRNARDPATGLKTRKVRIYHVPARSFAGPHSAGLCGLATNDRQFADDARGGELPRATKLRRVA